MSTFSRPVARGGWAKVGTLLTSSRLSTTTATLSLIVATTSKLPAQQQQSSAGAARLPQLRRQPRALHCTASSTRSSDWAVGSKMGDSIPRVAATAAAASVTSWDLTKPLPKLPVPELKSTMDKYLTLLTPVLTQQELDTTRQHVTEFLKPGGWGEQLQNQLLRRQADKDNWVYDWWLNDMYLRIRLPLPINSNPGAVFPRQYFNDTHQQLSFAAKFVCGLLDYKKMMDSGCLPVERCRALQKGQPVCMEQHYRMFSSYRRPGIPLDHQFTTLGTDRPPYIIVAYKNQFYQLSVQQQGVLVTESELYSQLAKLVAAAECDEEAPPVGVLTSANRSTWAEARERLAQDVGNAQNLDVIENSLFLLCLDKPTVSSVTRAETEVDEVVDVAEHMLHGQGTAVNTCNRWFDKTIQVVVSEGATCGFNYEHSVAEGVALMQLMEHALSYAARDDCGASQQEERQLSDPVRLQWTVTSQTRADIERASDDINKLINNLDFCVLRFDEYGRDFPKSQGFSPDAFIQLSLQLTYYKVHGCLVTTYESASLRRFRKGRVDNIRANSPAALAWIRAMLGETEATIQEKFALFKAAARWQQNYQIEAVLGQGMDCHLLGLREAAVELNVIDSVPLFSDFSFAKINNFKLSTSQVASTTDSFMCYGPVVPDGYGACYNPFPDRILVCVTSFRDCTDTDSQMFVYSLESSLLQMRELCLQGKSPLAS